MSDQKLTAWELISSYRKLFGGETKISLELVRSVSEAQLKKAYHKKVMRCHPDMHAGADENMKRRLHDDFIRIKDAYEKLLRFLIMDQRQKQELLIKTGKAAQTSSTYARPRQAEPRREQAQKQREQEQARRAQEQKRREQTANQRTQDTHKRGYSNEFSDRLHKVYKGFTKDQSTKADIVFPNRKLYFGEYLYYSKRITWKDLISAIVWQRNQRDRIGDIAKQWGWFTERDVSDVLPERQPNELIGRLLLRADMITKFNLKVLVYQQRSMQPKIGEFFVNKQMLSPKELVHCQHMLNKHNTQLAQAYRKAAQF